MPRRIDTILVADDEADELEKLVVNLQAEKFRVITVRNRDSLLDLS